jgi:hypothetical protein
MSMSSSTGWRSGLNRRFSCRHIAAPAASSQKWTQQQTSCATSYSCWQRTMI